MRFCCSLLPILNFRAFVSVWISLFPERHTIAVDNIRPPLLYTVYAMQMLANIRNTHTHSTTRFARLSCQVCVDIQCRFNVYFVCERDDVEFQMYKIHFVTLCFSHFVNVIQTNQGYFHGDTPMDVVKEVLNAFYLQTPFKHYI